MKMKLERGQVSTWYQQTTMVIVGVPKDCHYYKYSPQQRYENLER
jgi:hypothetical protein